MKAYLYNRKRPIISVDVENGHVLKIYEIVKEHEHLLPVMFMGETQLNLESLNRWLDRRKISEKREGLKEARMAFHGFDEHYHMFSLTDQYWFRYNKSETWEKLNFFTNMYSQEQGRIFFEPWLADEKEAVESEGPDLTTNGVLRKRWVQEENRKSYLIKAGSVQYHQEPLSEVLASLTLEKINLIDFVKYELIVYGLQFCSRCANFVTEHTEFVPALQVLCYRNPPADEYKYKHFIKMCHEFKIVGVEDYMQKMIAIDHILCNPDRHFGNFGFIRDCDNGKILGFAPLFDFGRAYWGSVIQDKTSRYFRDVEESCFKKAVKKMEVDALIDTQDMEKMVERYPELSDGQVSLICSKIQRMNKEIAKVKMPRSPIHDRLN